MPDPPAIGQKRSDKGTFWFSKVRQGDILVFEGSKTRMSPCLTFPCLTFRKPECHLIRLRRRRGVSCGHWRRFRVEPRKVPFPHGGEMRSQRSFDYMVNNQGKRRKNANIRVRSIFRQ